MNWEKLFQNRDLYFLLPILLVVNVTGRGGHGAMPHKTTDPILAASQMIGALQSVVSRRICPTEPAVISVCFVHSGFTFNVIPQTAQFGGTTRSFNNQTRKFLHDSINEIVQGTATAMGCEAEVKIHQGYPVTVNHEKTFQYLKQTVEKDIGSDCFIDLETPLMIGEDFAYYAQQVPACIMLLGIRDPEIPAEEFPQLHTSKFNFPDQAVEHGIRVMCQLAL